MRRSLRAPVVLALPLALALGACTAAGGGSTPAPSAAAQYSVLPVIVSSEQVVGTDRFVFAFISSSDNAPAATPTRTASVRAWPESKGQSDATSGTGTFMWAVPQVTGVYVTTLKFDTPGKWIAQFTTADKGKPAETIPFTFDVQQHASTLQVGQQVPSVRTPTLADAGGNVAAISSDTSPDPAFYQVSEDMALAQHQPFVLIFATPKFCVSRACGPMLDQVKAIAKANPGVTFINVEPYKLTFKDGSLQPVLDANGQLQPVEATQKFGLLSEPWVFVVDRTGKVTASFEGVVGPDELTAAIKAVE